MEIPNEIYAIARIVRREWKNIYFGAVPYLTAMEQITDINQYYGEDKADVIVRYFLSNATGWHGQIAKAVKLKLKELLSDN